MNKEIKCPVTVRTAGFSGSSESSWVKDMTDGEALVQSQYDK